MSVKVTIGVISYNRKKYTHALLESLKLIKDEDIQVVVVDNGSTEPGLIDMLKESEIIDDLYLGEKRDWINDEYIAKNKMIELTKGDVLLSMQDDRQIIGTSKYIKLFSQDLLNSGIPFMGVDAVRIKTLLTRVESKRGIQSQETGCKYWMNLNNHVGTTGLFIVDVLKELGPYPTDWPVDKSYWGRSEDFFTKRMWEKYPEACVSIRSHIPLMAAVWNDSRGGGAFIRDDIRYGEYESATDESGLYYNMLDNNDFEKLMNENRPQSFVDTCKPLGWDYAKDEDGDQRKYSQHIIVTEGPSEPVGNKIASKDKKSDNDITSATLDESWVSDWLDS